MSDPTDAPSTGSEAVPDLGAVDASFFAGILEADLANVVAKAQAGKPLTAREREMVEAELERRRAPEADGFHLELQEPTPWDHCTQAELAEAWGVSVRSIKGWKAEGVAANDPCPLTRPAEFLKWYERVHAPRTCPERYRLAAQKMLAKEPPRAPVVEAAPVRVPDLPENSKGLLAMLERHRSAEARLGTEYMAAVEAGDEIRASFLLTQWSNMGERLRALEKIAPRALEEMGIYVRKDDVRRELEPLHRSILKTFQQQFRVARPKMKASTTPEEWNALVDEIVEEAARMLTETQFREPLELTPETEVVA